MPMAINQICGSDDSTKLCSTFPLGGIKVLMGDLIHNVRFKDFVVCSHYLGAKEISLDRLFVT
jgi:hypothetical protein